MKCYNDRNSSKILGNKQKLKRKSNPSNKQLIDIKENNSMKSRVSYDISAVALTKKLKHKERTICVMLSIPYHKNNNSRVSSSMDSCKIIIIITIIPNHNNSIQR